jgi:hypothetical protein
VLLETSTELRPQVPANGEAEVPDLERATRRRFAIGSLVGAVLALIPFAWMLANGRADLTVSERFGNFYDAQAKALLSGHWDVPQSELFIEGFRVGGKTYTYFGLWPSLLRMPVLAFGDLYYSRLTQLSMLLAAAIALGAVACLHWRIRALVRPGSPCSRAEMAIAAAVVLSFGCGTTMLFLASRAWVYHEAILWGVAWSIASYERIIAFLRAPSRGRLVAASAFATLAFLSRPSVGMGPVVALALVLGGQLLVELRRWLVRRGAESGPGPTRSGPTRSVRLLDRLRWLAPEPGAGGGRRWVLGLFVAVLVPVVLYGYVNFSRFGTFFSVPWAKQFLVDINLQHRRLLDSNGGTYFGFKFGPTTLLQYLRPDALGPNPLFPFLTFPRFRTPIIGDLSFDSLDWSTSVPASMPALALLGAIGLWATVRCSFARTRAVAALRVPLLGAGAGVVLVLAIAFVANRYLGDWLPLLAIAGLTGLQVLMLRRTGPPRRRGASAVLVAAALLAVFGLWANFSLALVYQRLYNPAPYLASDRSGLLGLQYDIDGWLGGAPRAARFVDALPKDPARAGTTVVVGDCASVYWSDGGAWRAIQGRPAGGWFRLRVTPADGTRRTWQPVVAWGPRGRQNVIGIKRVGDDVHLGLGRPGSRTKPRWYESSFPITVSGRGFDVQVHVDQPLDEVHGTVNGESALELGNVRRMPDGPFTVGRATLPGAPRTFRGGIVRLTPEDGLCDRLSSRRTG